jgi:hypothetical protein
VGEDSDEHSSLPRSTPAAVGVALRGCGPTAQLPLAECIRNQICLRTISIAVSLVNSQSQHARLMFKQGTVECDAHHTCGSSMEGHAHAVLRTRKQMT